MKLTESYLKRLIKQVINEGLTQGQFNITQDPTDYKDLYDQYAKSGVPIERGEFTNLINILNKMKVKVDKWVAVACWSWDISDSQCTIC